MKKLIGDLTLREFIKECSKNEECVKCPLFGGCKGDGWPVCSISLDKEIEI